MNRTKTLNDHQAKKKQKSKDWKKKKKIYLDLLHVSKTTDSAADLSSSGCPAKERRKEI